MRKTALKPSWHVYILRCSDQSLYVGISTDVLRRVMRHNEGKGAKYTRGRLPVVLVWQENDLSESEARKRERELKGWSRAKKLALTASSLTQPVSPHSRT